MEAFQKSNSVLWETGAYLAQLEKENEIIEMQLQGLISSGVPEEQLIKQYDLPYKSSDSFSVQKPDLPKDALFQQQIIYLEARLESFSEHIKRLEETLRMKNAQLAALDKRTQRTTSPIREMMRDPPAVQTVFAKNLKRKEKELEKKLYESEQKMTEEVKTMQRLQNLNKNLMAKLKECREKEAEFKFKLDKVHIREARANNLIEENQHLGIINRDLREKINSVQEELNKMQASYNNLLATSIDFEEKSQELYQVNQMLNQKIQNILKNQ